MSVSLCPLVLLWVCWCSSHASTCLTIWGLSILLMSSFFVVSIHYWLNCVPSRLHATCHLDTSLYTFVYNSLSLSVELLLPKNSDCIWHEILSYVVYGVCRLRSAKVEDFVSALKKLHEDFRWPLPILSLSALRHISSGTANTIQASSCFPTRESIAVPKL